MKTFGPNTLATYITTGGECIPVKVVDISERTVKGTHAPGLAMTLRVTADRSDLGYPKNDTFVTGSVFVVPRENMGSRDGQPVARGGWRWAA